MFSPETGNTYLVVVDLQAACRFCLEPRGALSPTDPDLLRQAEELMGLQVVEDHNLPEKICHRCRYKLELFHEFKNTLIDTQKTLLEFATGDANDESSTANNLPAKELQPAADLQPVEESQSTVECERNYQHVKSETVCTENGNSFDHKLINNVISESELKLCIGNANTKELDISAEKSGEVHNDKVPAEYPSMMFALKNNQCLLCFEECGERKSLQEHVEKHVDGSLLEPYYLVNDRDIVCKACGQAFGYRYSFVEHQRQHLNIRPFVCTQDDCTLSFFSKTAWTNHLQIHAERNFVCSTCGMGFKRKSALKVHTIIHKDEGGTFACPVCGIYCKNRLTCASHIKTHTSVPKHKCKVCSKDYYSQSELKRHMLSHSEKKLFHCNTCGRAYYSKSALIRHCREAGHTLDSNYVNITCGKQILSRKNCVKCKTMFENRVTFEAHVCGNFPHQCGDCKKELTPKELHNNFHSCKKAGVGLNLTKDWSSLAVKEQYKNEPSEGITKINNQ